MCQFIVQSLTIIPIYSLLCVFDYRMMNMSYLDISVNSDSSFDFSFESNRNVAENTRLDENDKNQSTESTVQKNDSVLPDVSISSNTSAICISPSKHDSHSDVSSSTEGDFFNNIYNNNYK